MPIATLACAVCLALVHLATPRLRFLAVVPRSRWLSAAGGVAVAYVFLHILPELAARRAHLAEAEALGAEQAIFVIALVGLVVFYGLERLVRGVRVTRRQAGAGSDGTGAFWLHIGSFSLYNALIGYLLLHRETSGTAGLLLYFIAMALHFLTNDFGLRQDHREDYDRIARWVLAAAVLAGWIVGLAVDFDDEAVGALFAFLAGGVVLNVLKEELPAERQSRFVPFAAGAAGYAALLLAVE